MHERVNSNCVIWDLVEPFFDDSEDIAIMYPYSKQFHVESYGIDNKVNCYSGFLSRC